jgi:hypothetical protein
MTKAEAGKLGHIKAQAKLAEYTAKRRNKLIREYVPVNCLHCGTPIPFEKRGCKFCNHSCAASHTNLGGQKNKPKPPINPGGKCLACDKTIKTNKIYCNTQCQQNAAFEIRKAKVESTGDLWQGWQTERSVRDFLLKTRPNQCAVCGITKWMGEATPLVMDHIDGNPENWLVGNLRLICPNCDAQTDTYKGRNKKGMGRWKRRQRYAEGKSS